MLDFLVCIEGPRRTGLNELDSDSAKNYLSACFKFPLRLGALGTMGCQNVASSS